jgi:hypothetical protein
VGKPVWFAGSVFLHSYRPYVPGQEDPGQGGLEWNTEGKGQEYPYGEGLTVHPVNFTEEVKMVRTGNRPFRFYFFCFYIYLH